MIFLFVSSCGEVLSQLVSLSGSGGGLVGARVQEGQSLHHSQCQWRC